MTEFTPSLPIVNKSDSTEEPKVTTAFEELKTIVNGKIDKTNTAAEVPLIASTAKYVAIKTFTKVEANAGVEISATRPAFLSIHATAEAAKLEIGGVEVIATISATTNETYLVPAASKWKVNSPVSASWIIC